MRNTRPEYDSVMFRRLWFSRVTIARMAKRYGANESNIYKAARRRGYPGKWTIWQMRKAAR